MIEFGKSYYVKGEFGRGWVVWMRFVESGESDVGVLVRNPAD